MTVIEIPLAYLLTLYFILFGPLKAFGIYASDGSYE
jgi:hypothetical protein